MPETLLVCSKSTRNFFPQYKRVYIVGKEPSVEILKLHNSEERVVAVGGGAVIDVAKIISRNPIICYPTTAAGSACTSHAVYWDGDKKCSLKAHVPSEVYVCEEFLADLPSSVKIETTYDALSHCLDSMWSKYRTGESLHYVDQALKILCTKNLSNVDLVRAGNIAGKAIQICPTTILHSMSYPLTGIYHISHGKALGFLLYEVAKFMDTDVTAFIDKPKYHFDNLDCDLLAMEALTYDKIYDIEKRVTFEEIRDIYMRANELR